MSHSAARLLYWSPRILSIAFALFLGLFALDVFNEGHNFWRTGLALAIHLIPSAIVVAVLIAAWRWEWIGAGLYLLAATYYTWSVLPSHPDWALAIAGPLLLIAALFLVNSIERAKLRAAL
jgi:hypothetical protein